MSSNFCKWAIFWACLAFVLLAFIKGCDHIPDTGNMINDTLRPKELSLLSDIESLKIIATNLSNENDSLKKLPPVIRIRYRTIYDSLYFTDALCQKSLKMVYDRCNELDSSNISVIESQSWIIENDTKQLAKFDTLLTIKGLQHKFDSLVITKAKADLEAEKKSKRKYFKGLLHGTLIGGALVGGAIIIK